jgi:NADPH:quinone reductase-like Zn-dependent oxidoreductase
VLGTEFAGEIAAVGAAVTALQRGDRVFGVNADRFGAHAEYLRVRERGPIAAMPSSMTFDEGAAICDGFVIARKCLRAGRLEAGQRVLIYGASGSIGTAAVQLAKHMGAEVTAVCNTANVEVVTSLGADVVIDYTRGPFLTDDERYDVIFDAVGKISFGRCKASLKPGGFYVDTDLGYLWQVPALALWTRFFGKKRVLLPIPRYRKDEVLLLRDLFESGCYRAVIDRAYPLDEVVEATRYVETEQKTGNVVLRVRTDG